MDNNNYDDEEVFFVESDEEDQQQHPLVSRKAQEEVFCMQDEPAASLQGASMEDMLFNFKPARPPPPPPSVGNATTPYNSSHNSTGKATTVPSSDDAAWYAGGSPEAMPSLRQEPVPQPLEDLRRMTTAEVREILEPFFARKEMDEQKFAAASESVALMQAGHSNSNDDNENNNNNNSETGAEDGEASPEAWRVRDRYARLVNIGNWGSGDVAKDVLLPAALVQNSSYHHRRRQSSNNNSSSNQIADGSTAAGANAEHNTGARAFSASSSPSPPPAPRTLRDHQVQGIRFLWNVLVEGPVGRVPAVGCILAHTMGLGKTAQVVLFSHLFSAAFTLNHTASNNVRRRPRICVVAPKSTIPGWVKEFSSWSAFFPSEHRLEPLVLEESSRPKRRIEVFHQWRREGGVFLIGYEALTRLMQLVEDDMVLTGADGAFRGSADPMSMQMNRMLKRTRRVDEGGVAFGGDADPYTELVVCDEAHRLKSVHLQVVTALRGLHPLRRMLLTGTPLQNHLSEYWAMVDFAMHRYFDQRRFKDYFVNPIESTVSKSASKASVALARKKTFTLINEVKHFVLRVDSTPLKKELPPLHEYVVVLPMTDMQKELYLKFLKEVRSSRNGDRFHFLPAVSLSGKIVCHPQLVYEMKARQMHNSGGRGGRKRPSAEVESYDGDEEERMATISFSGMYRSAQYDSLCDAPKGYKPDLHDGIKLRVSLQIIKEAMRLGEKTLFFSLSTALLDFFESLILKDNMESAPQQQQQQHRSIRFCRLDGSNTSRQRADLLRAFNSKDGPDVFLLSTKAGGVGVTITAATRVILVDTSFNPADDQQAIGRAYRYGQRKPVHVYRLLCQHTLEYSIFEQKLAKEWLFKTVVEDTAVKRDALSGMHLKEIFGLLGRSARELQRPPKPTPKQAAITADLVVHDTILASIAPHMVYAQRYAMCLEIDPTVEYGEEEKLFYNKYRQDKVFAVNEDEGNDKDSNDMKARNQREMQAEQLSVQASSLTSMVDRLIRSRSGNDSHLASLLSAMGVRVDGAGQVVMSAPASPTTPTAEAASSMPSRSSHNNTSNNTHEGKGDVYEYGTDVGRTTQYQRRLLQQDLPAAAAADDDDGGQRASQPMILDDSDESILEVAPSRGGDLAAAAAATSVLSPRAPLVVNPARYARFRPGGSSSEVILIDEDEE